MSGAGKRLGGQIDLGCGERPGRCSRQQGGARRGETLARHHVSQSVISSVRRPRPPARAVSLSLMWHASEIIHLRGRVGGNARQHGRRVRTSEMGRVHWWEWRWPSVTVPLHRRPRIPSPRNAVSVSNLFLNDHLSSCAVLLAGPTCGPHK